MITVLLILAIAIAVAAYITIGLAFLGFYPLADGPFENAYIVLTWPLTLALLIVAAPFVLAYEGAHRLIQWVKRGA